MAFTHQSIFVLVFNIEVMWNCERSVFTFYYVPLQSSGLWGFPKTALPSFHTCLPPLSACPFSSDSVFSCALLCCVLLCCAVLCFIVSGCLCCGCCVALYPPSTWTYFWSLLFLFCCCICIVCCACYLLYLNFFNWHFVVFLWYFLVCIFFVMLQLHTIAFPGFPEPANCFGVCLALFYVVVLRHLLVCLWQISVVVVVVLLDSTHSMQLPSHTGRGVAQLD